MSQYLPIFIAALGMAAAFYIADRDSPISRVLALAFAASGLVTVGVIDSTSRLEYTAVGAAVNLASRLCERAADGEILADGHRVRLAAATDFKRGEAVKVQGFAGVMELFASRAWRPA